jgi:prepilin-type N-terminal cleavage/methylation domain-containing protein
MKYKKGFTLIEVLLVMVIIAILAYFSASYIVKEINKSKIVSDIRKMYGLLQEGREKAFAEKRNIKFNLDLTNKKACLLDENDNVISCVDLNSNEYSATKNPIIIDKRGTFQNGTIYYTGSLDHLSYSCIAISNLRVKMGVWDGSSCEVK